MGEKDCSIKVHATPCQTTMREPVWGSCSRGSSNDGEGGGDRIIGKGNRPKLIVPETDVILKGLESQSSGPGRIRSADSQYQPKFIVHPSQTAGTLVEDISEKCSSDDKDRSWGQIETPAKEVREKKWSPIRSPSPLTMADTPCNPKFIPPPPFHSSSTLVEDSSKKCSDEPKDKSSSPIGTSAKEEKEKKWNLICDPSPSSAIPETPSSMKKGFGARRKIRRVSSDKEAIRPLRRCLSATLPTSPGVQTESITRSISMVTESTQSDINNNDNSEGNRTLTLSPPAHQHTFDVCPDWDKPTDYGDMTFREHSNSSFEPAEPTPDLDQTSELLHHMVVNKQQTFPRHEHDLRGSHERLLVSRSSKASSHSSQCYMDIENERRRQKRDVVSTHDT